MIFDNDSKFPKLSELHIAAKFKSLHDNFKFLTCLNVEQKAYILFTMDILTFLLCC